MSGINDRSRITDDLQRAASYNRSRLDAVGIRGHGVVEVWTPRRNLLAGPGGLILKQSVEFTNLVTQVGDQWLGERAAGIASPPAQVSGMRLGTGVTTPSKTGAGAAIVTYVSGSSLAIDATWPQSSLNGASRRIQWKVTWAAGVATANNISEAVITNEASLTNVAGTAANTIARGLVSPTVNKDTGDSLVITWNHDILGA